MNCPKCQSEMEFEEVKNWCGTWFCECGFEGEGSRTPCDYDHNGVGFVPCDHEETLERGVA